MTDNISYALEIGNKVYTYKNKDTFIFCSEIQIKKLYPDLENKQISFTVNVDKLEDLEESKRFKLYPNVRFEDFIYD